MRNSSFIGEIKHKEPLNVSFSAQNLSISVITGQQYRILYLLI